MPSHTFAIRGGTAARTGAWICSRCIAQSRTYSSLVARQRGLREVSRHLSSDGSRPAAPRSFLADAQQRRWISQNHLRNIEAAEADWRQRTEAIKAGDKKSIFDVLEERGLINQIVGTRHELKNVLDVRRVGVYCGVDPTAPSMHVGHMIPFMALSWMYVYGYPVTFLLGGATARIGDPEGRLTARPDVARVERSANTALMHTQIKRFGEMMERYAERRGWKREWAWRRSLINNADWHAKLTWPEMMREMGKHVRIGPMLGRDSVKNRLEHGEGMSFAEFSYPIMQAWDWWHMFKTGTQVQIGGADQFGNILQGAESVKLAAKHDTEWQEKMNRVYSVEVSEVEEVSEWPLGFTTPLLTTSSGDKFGKSAGNAIWLSRDMTTEFELYQFWLRTADADVERYLKMFTFLPISEIEGLMEEHRRNESQRVAQHKLAKEFVELIHGPKAAEQVETTHRTMYNKNMSFDEMIKLAAEQKQPPLAEIETHPSLTKNGKPQDLEKHSMNKMYLPQSAVLGRPLAGILWSAGFVASKSEGQRLINSKGAYIGGRTGAKRLDGLDAMKYTQITDPAWNWWKDFLIDDKLLILRSGKWRIKVIDIIPDDEFRNMGLMCPGFDEHLVSEIRPGPMPVQSTIHAYREPMEADDNEDDTPAGWDRVSPVARGRAVKKFLGAGPDINTRNKQRGAHERRFEK